MACPRSVSLIGSVSDSGSEESDTNLTCHFITVPNYCWPTQEVEPPCPLAAGFPLVIGVEPDRQQGQLNKRRLVLWVAFSSGTYE